MLREKIDHAACGPRYLSQQLFVGWPWLRLSPHQLQAVRWSSRWKEVLLLAQAHSWSPHPLGLLHSHHCCLVQACTGWPECPAISCKRVFCVVEVALNLWRIVSLCCTHSMRERLDLAVLRAALFSEGSAASLPPCHVRTSAVNSHVGEQDGWNGLAFTLVPMPEHLPCFCLRAQCLRFSQVCLSASAQYENENET